MKQEEQQGGTFLSCDNLRPRLGRMAAVVTPFGAGRYPSETGWAATTTPPLFPAALDLDALDTQQYRDLRTWFVAHVDIKPPTTRRRQPPSDIEQLSLL